MKSQYTSPVSIENQSGHVGPNINFFVQLLMEKSMLLADRQERELEIGLVFLLFVLYGVRAVRWCHVVGGVSYGTLGIHLGCCF